MWFCNWILWEQFLYQLPEKFDRPVYLELAKSLSIPVRTAETYITNFSKKGLIFREQQGLYTNLSLSKDIERWKWVYAVYVIYVIYVIVYFTYKLTLGRTT